MNTAQSDLVEWYKLETEFSQDHVRHTRYVERGGNRYKKVKEDWNDCGELGTGGFGVVYKQVRGTTAHYRAVKTVDKRRLPHGVDYYRELLIMAILAKHPLLFVKFLGWFEKPETLFIAMEYLPEGDLTKHLGSPLPQETVKTISKQVLEGLKVMHQKGIAHRDLKPANIFVVSMSPVRVKLGDFGISKRIQPEAVTTFNTQVATQIYGAPEVLGLDSSSETSVYTNSVDIWSLGCVIYELLAGTRLFASETQVSRYFFGISPFPEDKLKALPTPTDDVGIALLKSMLEIQPEDRPTVADALGNAWLMGLESDDEDSGDDQDEMAQSGSEGTCSGESEGRRTTRDEPKQRGGQRNSIIRDDSKSTLGNVALGAESEIDTDMVMQGAEEKTGPPYSTNMSPRPPASDPPTLDPYLDSPTRIRNWQTYPNRQASLRSDDSETSEHESLRTSGPNASGENGGSWGGPTAGPMGGLNVRKTSNAGRNPNAGWNPNQNPNAGWNPNQNPNAGWNPNQNPNASWNSNQNPNAGWNPNQNPNAGWNPNQNPNAGSNPNWNPNVNSNPNQNPNLGWVLKSGGNPNAGWNPNAGGNPNMGWNPNAGGNRNLGQTY